MLLNKQTARSMRRKTERVEASDQGLLRGPGREALADNLIGPRRAATDDHIEKKPTNALTAVQRASVQHARPNCSGALGFAEAAPQESRCRAGD